jgi:hypothetical protein
MSVMLIGDAAVHALLSYVIAKNLYLQHPTFPDRWQPIDKDDADSIGAKLIAINHRAYDNLYRTEPVAAPRPYQFRFTTTINAPETRSITALDVLKLCDFVEYQCCELDAWHGSYERGIIQSIRASSVQDLPGYQDAPWGL